MKLDFTKTEKNNLKATNIKPYTISKFNNCLSYTILIS